MVASELFSSLAAPIFAAMLFIFFLKRRSREINGGEANNNAAANDGTAGGDSGTYTSTEVPEVATSSGANKDAAANDGTAGGDSGTHTSTEVPELATSSGYDYEVFLSFRGPDTRAAFTDFLYTNLIDAGIRAYKDDKELPEGEEFGPKLLQAIYESKISIPIFSKGYAYSVWCLKEVAEMVKCRETRGQKIIPIFYDVAPAEVRYQTGDYEKAFLSHESKKRYDQKTIGEWKAALDTVGGINGHDLQSMPNRREGEFVKTFTQKVFNELKKASLAVSDCLVSVETQVDEIMEKIGAGTSETGIIGIHGMGGIGKTTIAKIIFNKFLHDFENCCFLSDIRETSKKNGIHHLQSQLISKILKTECMDIKDIHQGTQTIKDRLMNKKVLLLLDDVEEPNHIKAFVGKRDWLGSGSKVIITTRNKDILEVSEVNCKYELSCMDDDQSLRLFSKHAFRRDSPLDEYIDQSKRAIGIAGGLPLALEVIGSLLSGKNKKMWDDKLEKLEKVPHVDVQSKLKISFDALDFRQQHIFLDIACFFIGHDKDIMVHFWEKSIYFPEEVMEVLQNMSLIKIRWGNEVWMHDQLRDLGREMVHQESKMKIDMQSRVWDPTEALKLLRKHEGETKVEALHLHFDRERQYRFTCKDFKRMSNLRFLQVNGSEEYFHAEERLLWHESPSNILPTNVIQENLDLLSHLRWLSWHGIPPTFKIANFSMEDVVILDLSRSKITHNWQGWSHMEVMKNLKILNLTRCKCLERTPTFFAKVNLERLILKWCESLIEIDGSICHLKSLVSLDVSGCNNLRRLPDELGRDLASLEYLSLNYCKLFERLPNTIGNLESLIELDISQTGIKELPDSIGNLKSLIKLDISQTEIKELPDSIGNLESLIKLYISQTGIKELPDSIGNLESLIKLDISQTEIKELSDSIGNLESLIELDISQTRIKELPDSIGNLGSLIELDISQTEIKELPDSIENLESLIKLDISQTRIKELSDSIGNLESLIELNISQTGIKELPDSIGKLKNLKVAKMNRIAMSKIPDAFWTIEKLEEINTQFDFDVKVEIDNCIYRNQSLRILRLTNARINMVPRLPESLIALDLDGLYPFPDLSNLTNLKKLRLRFSQHVDGGDSDGPVEECLMSRRIGNLSKLETLFLRSDNVTTLPADISSLLPRLEQLTLECRNLHCLPSLPSSLSFLSLQSDCVTALPTDCISLLPRLRSLYNYCRNLRCLPSLPSSLSFLYLRSDCVTALPADISSLLPRLEQLTLECRNLHCLPSLPSSLSFLSLQSDCVTALPTDINSLLPRLINLSIKCRNLRCLPSLPSSLAFLSLQSDCVTALPTDISSLLPRLQTLSINCHNLRCLPSLPSRLSYLSLQSDCVTALPTDISSLLPRLQHLLINCRNLRGLPSLPSSLSSLSLHSDCVTALPTDISSLLPRLQNLYIFCRNLRCLPSLPSSLSTLYLQSDCVTALPTDISSLLPRLRSLYIRCRNLRCLPSLPSSLSSLSLVDCKSFGSLGDLSNLKNLSSLRFFDSVISEIRGLDGSENRDLQLSELQQGGILPDLSNINQLRSLEVYRCGNLVEIQGELPQSLEELEIGSCGSLRKLPDLSSLKRLRRVEINDCGKLNVEAISLLCSEKAIEFEFEYGYEGED